MTNGMNLSHYSSKPVGPIRSIPQQLNPEYRSCYDKPKGFWVSVDGEDDWAAWCNSESFGLGTLRHRVTLREPNDLLVLRTAEELRAFTKQYGKMESRSTYARPYINWQRVGEVHGGLIIAPYIWECRLESDTSWYYGWDCASGCIWNADAIHSVELMQEQVAA